MIYSLNTKLSFGKYAGLTVSAVASFNPRYLIWACRNLDSVTLDDVAMNAIRSAAAKEQRFSLEQQNAWAWGFGGGAKSARQRHSAQLIRIEHEERRKAGQVCEIDRFGRIKWLPSPDTHRKAETGTGSVHGQREKAPNDTEGKQQ